MESKGELNECERKGKKKRAAQPTKHQHSAAIDEVTHEEDDALGAHGGVAKDGERD